MWATMERVSYLHSTDDGPKVRNRSTIWLKSSNQCRSCVDRVPIQHQTHFSELADFIVFITGYEPRPSFAISLTAEQISQCVNFKFNKLKWRVGSVASNWNPANNWCQRWVKVLPQSINQDQNSSMEGQEPSKVEVRSRAKLQKECNSKCMPM